MTSREGHERAQATPEYVPTHRMRMVEAFEARNKPKQARTSVLARPGQLAKPELVPEAVQIMGTVWSHPRLPLPLFRQSMIWSPST